MSKKKTRTKSQQQATSVQTVAPSQQYQPHIDAGAAALRPAYEAAQSNVDSILPRLNEGMDYYSDVLQGQYLNGNPYLDDVIGDTNQSVADTVAGQFSGAGRYGSGYHTRTLTDRLAANENTLRMGEYGRERGYMNEAPGRLTSLAATSAALPQAPSTAYAQALAQLLGRYNTANSSGTQSGTSTTTQSGSILDTLLQAGSAAAFAFGGIPGGK